VKSTDFTGLLLLTCLTDDSYLCLIQASSPLQVKYADGELERLGMVAVSADLMSLPDFVHVSLIFVPILY
jgi:hypothetical protein